MRQKPESVRFVRRALQTLAPATGAGVSQTGTRCFLIAWRAARVDRFACDRNRKSETRVKPLYKEEISLENAGSRLDNDMPIYTHFLGRIKDIDSSYRLG